MAARQAQSTWRRHAAGRGEAESWTRGEVVEWAVQHRIGGKCSSPAGHATSPKFTFYCGGSRRQMLPDHADCPGAEGNKHIRFRQAAGVNGITVRSVKEPYTLAPRRFSRENGFNLSKMTTTRCDAMRRGAAIPHEQFP
jgi:hypothetical protein